MARVSSLTPWRTSRIESRSNPATCAIPAWRNRRACIARRKTFTTDYWMLQGLSRAWNRKLMQATEWKLRLAPTSSETDAHLLNFWFNSVYKVALGLQMPQDNSCACMIYSEVQHNWHSADHGSLQHCERLRILAFVESLAAKLRKMYLSKDILSLITWKTFLE